MLFFKNPNTGEVFAYETQNERDQFGDASLVVMTQAEIDAHINPQPTPAQLQEQCELALQSRLDTYAKSWGYDSIVSAASYAASTNAKFKAESLALIGWRDSVWAWAESLTALPASVDALLSAMPTAPARPTV